MKIELTGDRGAVAAAISGATAALVLAVFVSAAALLAAEAVALAGVWASRKYRDGKGNKDDVIDVKCEEVK